MGTRLHCSQNIQYNLIQVVVQYKWMMVYGYHLDMIFQVIGCFTNFYQRYHMSTTWTVKKKVDTNH
jgi:hypothetical protein